MRRILFWIHLAAGVIAGSIILVMSLTGVILAYERQMVDWLERGYHATAQERQAPRLPAADLIAPAMAFKGAEAAPPSTLTLQRGEDEPVALSWGRGETLYLNPYTGKVLGEGTPARGFFRTVVGWHRWLGDRESGRAITGACNFAFVILILTGMILWMPRRWPWKWTWRSLRPGLLFDRRLKGRSRDWNWHLVIGIWCAPVLFILAATGTTWSYTWASNLIYIVSGETPPPPRQEGRGPGRGKEARRGDGRKAPPFRPVALEPYLDAAKARVPGWQSISITLPSPRAREVSLSVSEKLAWHPSARSSLKLDAKTAQVVEWKPFMEQSLGSRIRGTIRPVHTGEAGGLPGQTIAALASLGGVFLVWTGLALSWRRFFGRKKKLAAAPEPAKSAS